MKYVVDASFVASLLLPDEFSDQTQQEATTIFSKTVIAPEFLQIEFSNILITAQRRERITSLEREKILETFNSLPIIFSEKLSIEQRNKSIAIATQYKISMYDAVYLELGVRESAKVKSYDKKLLLVIKDMEMY